MEIKPTGIKGFSEVYDDEGNVKMTLAYVETKEKEKSAKEMFEELGYEYDYIQNKNSEDTITYHKDNLHIQFNLISKVVVCKNDTSYMFYNSAVFFINKDLLKAINKQVEELGWDNE